ncbi:MAG: choice-of-anchor Q domain-containing protein [Rudaea sp.]|nr:choice-of-anchor Q domain-containing protein [Rudaea sp.]
MRSNQIANGLSRRPIALALSLALAAIAPAAGAATVEVTTADDAATSSTCTLRQAISAMNAAAVGVSSSCVNSGGSFGTGDTITFAADVTAVSLADIANNELLITDPSLAIQGTGMGGVTVSRVTGATNPFRIFHDTASAAGNFLYLTGLTISNGATTAANANGGAIFVDTRQDGELVLTNCVVSGNSTGGANAVGGAIAVGDAFNDGTVQVLNSVISGNSTGGYGAAGGAIYATHQAYLKDSIVSGNSTIGNSSPGGAIRTIVTILYSSTITDNFTQGNYSGGGAIATLGASGADGVEGNYSTISGNSTSGYMSPGGAINTRFFGTALYFLISNNSTSGNKSNGGGVYSRESFIDDSVVTGNEVTGDDSNGGGIWTRSGTVQRSTLSANHASGTGDSGGALWAISAHLVESTLSGNVAASGGGGLTGNVCTSSTPSFAIYNSTIAFNTTDSAGGAAVYLGSSGCAGLGAGNSQQISSAITVASSILSNNTVDSVVSADIGVQSGFALTVNTSYDLMQRPPSNAAIMLVNAAGTPALITLGPRLIALGNNGCGKKSGAPGTSICVPTHAIGCSPAVDSGSNPLSAIDDERGTGYARLSGNAPDIGAYELQPGGDEIFCDGFDGLE